MEDKLFIKQSAILEVIREYKLIQMKTLKRSFYTTPERTLRYHLRRLRLAGLVRKRGTTKGVYYEAI